MGSERVDVVLEMYVRELCYRRYPGHPRGCPNYGSRATCPPAAPHFDNVIDLAKPVFAIWNIFNLAEHREKMKLTHPGWSEKQLTCCLYWQPKARKALEEQIMMFNLRCPGLLVLRCPEACGVNVTETMRKIGQVLEWPPVTKTYQVAIAGTKKKSRRK